MEMLPIAQKIFSDGHYQPVFYLSRNVTSDQIELLKQYQMDIINKDALDIHQSNSTNPEKSPEKSPFWKQMIPFGVREVISAWREYKQALHRVKELLQQHDIVALILVGDRHIGWETAIIKESQQKSIPSLIVPFAWSDPDGNAEFRLRKPNGLWLHGMNRLSNRIAAFFQPQWVYEYKGHKLLFLPGGPSLIAKLVGIMPEKPWSLGGGKANKMAVESQRIQCALVDQDIASEKLLVTGKPSHDQIYNDIQEADHETLRAELGIESNQKVLLCSLPQLAEHHLLSWPEHWKEIEFLLDTFAQLENVAVVLSLHPKCDRNAYQPLADKYGAVIADERFYNILPICDVFVSTFSSTVVAAIGLGKPSVVVDFYELNYSFYDDAPGVVIVDQKNLLHPNLTKLLTETAHYTQMVQTQKTHAKQWILLDGKATERVTHELYHLIKTSLITPSIK